jgi:UDP-glucose 4-epimerase
VTGAAEARAVVTGVAGFVGSHLAEALLSRGHRVIGIDSFSDFYPVEIKHDNLAALTNAPGFTLVRGDLVDLPLAEHLDGAAFVYHCAARAGVRSSWGAEFDRYAHDNLLATQRLLEASKGTGLSRFVYTSSSSVYGNARTLPVTEEHPVAPISPYGATKLSGEHLGAIYHESYGVPFVALRLFTVYGPRQRPDMAFHRFLSATAAGRPIDVFGDGRQTRDFTFVADAVAALVAAGTAPSVVGETINVASGRRVSLLDVFETIASVAGRAPELRFHEKGRGEADHTFASIEKARRLLGYAPRVSLPDGLRQELAWLRRLEGQVRVAR